MHKFIPRHILVTGGAGFIGSNYIRYVLRERSPECIINLDALTYAGSMANLSNLPNDDRHHFIHGDICDAALVEGILRKHQIDTIVHFAAESHVDRSIVGPQQFIHTNVIGTFTLLETARKVWLQEMGYNASNCRFHHISTDEVYGTLDKTSAPFTENTPYAPNSPYSASKASSDHLVRAYHATYQLPITLTNCSNNFGPYQHGEKFIPTVIKSCFQRKPIPIYGDGKNIRDWLYVEDHCKNIQAVIEAGTCGESYNIGGDYELDNQTLALKICNFMDELYPQHRPHTALVKFVKDRPGHDFRYAINSNKLKNAGLWQQPSCFDDNLKKTIEFYQQ